MKKLKILSMILLFALFITLLFCHSVQATYIHIDIESKPEECVYNSDGDIMIKQSSNPSITVSDADISEVVSSDENVVKVDASGKLIIVSTGKCTLSVPEKDGKEAFSRNLIILSDQTFEKAKSDEKMLDGLKIVGEQAKWYLSGEEYRGDTGEILVGGSGQIVLADGSKLSGATYAIDEYDPEGYITVDSNGMITALAEHVESSSHVVVTLTREEYSLSAYVDVVGVKEFTTPKVDEGNDGENQGGNQGQIPEQNGNQNEGEPQGNASQSSGTQSENRTLDNEPKTGIDTKTSIFVSGLALVSLAVAIIARKI